jgi:hypothetical protein
MGQFDSYIERNAPPSPRTTRAFNMAVPVVAIVYVIVERDVSYVPLAAFFTLMFLPAGVAPKAYNRAFAALDRHTVPSALCLFAFSLAGPFAFLSTIVSYSTSLYIAAPVAVVLTTYGTIRRQARLRGRTS